MAALLLIGMIYDGGENNTYRSEATSIAAEAARAGADELDVDYLRTTGLARLDPNAAEAAAAAWIATAGYDGTVAATTSEVTVAVTIDQPLLLLRVGETDTITVTADATAAPRTGINEPFEQGDP
ncbi:hypothetical protein GCM10029992_36090 [Glycomyces albus]